MSDETPLIFGDAAAAEVERYPGRRWFRQKKKERPPLTHCENCGAPLTGRYCAQCGQPAIDYHRSFGSILADAADAFFNLDERFLKTFWLLLIKPWRLTNEFVEGEAGSLRSPPACVFDRQRSFLPRHQFSFPR
jgi:hypothetical protein